MGQFVFGLFAGIVVGLVMEWVIDWAGLLPSKSRKAAGSNSQVKPATGGAPASRTSLGGQNVKPGSSDADQEYPASTGDEE